MLRQAQEVMDKGLMTPTELEAQLLAHLSVRCNAHPSHICDHHSNTVCQSTCRRPFLATVRICGLSATALHISTCEKPQPG